MLLIVSIYTRCIVHYIAKDNTRPLLVGECSSLPDAENHRRDIIRDISKKISAIQNANLGEHRVRELNDEINKLQRTRHYWETRIKELGGADFKANKTKQYIDIEGKELPGARGYKYYGVARELPGVRELFAESELDRVKHLKGKKSRKDLYANITPDYYGYRDDISSGMDTSVGVDIGVGHGTVLSQHQGDRSVMEQKEQEMEIYWKNRLESTYNTEKKRKMEDFIRSGGLFNRLSAPDEEVDEDISDDDDEDLEAFDAEMRVWRTTRTANMEATVVSNASIANVVKTDATSSDI